MHDLDDELIYESQNRLVSLATNDRFFEPFEMTENNACDNCIYFVFISDQHFR